MSKPNIRQNNNQPSCKEYLASGEHSHVYTGEYTKGPRASGRNPDYYLRTPRTEGGAPPTKCPQLLVG